MKKTIDCILYLLKCRTKSWKVRNFLKYISKFIGSNPRLDHEEEQLLTFWIRKKRNQRDMSPLSSSKIAIWVNTCISGLSEPIYDVQVI